MHYLALQKLESGPLGKRFEDRKALLPTTFHDDYNDLTLK